jgi:hypothetical protein
MKAFLWMKASTESKPPWAKPSFLFNDLPKTIQTALAGFLFLTPPP